MKIKKSEIENMVKEEIAALKKEDVTLPGNVRRFMDKLVDALKNKGLNRKRQAAILGGVIDSLGIDPSQLMRMVKMAKKDSLSRGLPEGKQSLTEGDKFSPEQMKFAKPIFQTAAKKGGFKIKKMFMSFQPTAQIETFAFGKDGGSMTSIWGHAMNKRSVALLKKAWEQADMDIKMSEFKPKFHVSKDDQFITLADASRFTGQKYDRKEYDRLFRS